MYRLNAAIVTRVTVATGSTMAPGSLKMAENEPCGASAGNTCSRTDSTSMSSSATQKAGVE